MRAINYRVGEFLDSVVPKYFDEVYDRVEKNANKKYLELQERVLKYEKLQVSYTKVRKKLPNSYDTGGYDIELKSAQEHLKGFAEANADFLI